MELANERCTACRADAPKVGPEEAQQLLADLPGWSIQEYDGEPHLVRHYSFPNFADALRFTIKVGELAEEEGHHPSLITVWGKVTVHWWTHKIHGLHRNDFIMAARTDGLLAA